MFWTELESTFHWGRSSHISTKVETVSRLKLLFFCGVGLHFQKSKSLDSHFLQKQQYNHCQFTKREIIEKKNIKKESKRKRKEKLLNIIPELIHKIALLPLNIIVCELMKRRIYITQSCFCLKIKEFFVCHVLLFTKNKNHNRAAAGK